MTDLVKRLRDVQIHTIPVDLDTLTNEAAAALEAKDAELARLREALGWIAENDDEGDMLYRRDGPFAKRARAALQAKE